MKLYDYNYFLQNILMFFTRSIHDYTFPKDLYNNTVFSFKVLLQKPYDGSLIFLLLDIHIDVSGYYKILDSCPNPLTVIPLFVFFL